MKTIDQLLRDERNKAIDEYRRPFLEAIRAKQLAQVIIEPVADTRMHPKPLGRGRRWL